jgi:hypothetical protein
MRAAKATEWSFQGNVTFWFKDLCRQPGSVFKAFEQDERLPEGERPDGVLYGRVNDAFCEFELKRPNVPAEDMGLAMKAANKAMQLGAKYFVTWNVNELVLWTPDFGKRPWQWDRRKDKIASIYDLSQYPLLKPALEAAVKKLFQQLSALYVAAEPKKHFPPVPLDEKFIDFVQSHVDAFAFSFAEAIKAQEGNLAFMRRLREWFNEQQLPFVQDERRFIQAGRILAHLLINRGIFYEEDGDYAGAKWGKYARAPDVYFKIVTKGKGKLVPLRKIADVRRGFTTGVNEWFYLTEQQAKEWQIERRFLKPLLKSPRECDSILIKKDASRSYVIFCHDSRHSLRGTNLLRYMRDI